MADITNSSSLTEFQRNARGFIHGLNESKVPLLLTVNGKVQAVLVDPATYQAMEERLQRERFIAAVKEGLNDIDIGDVRPAEDVIEDVRTKYGL
jgi:PHD/YefM family antitoxin component YafN of YafNO toxin-antitoxin module